MSMLRKPFEANAIIHRVMAKTSFETAKLARAHDYQIPLFQPLVNQFSTNFPQIFRECPRARKQQHSQVSCLYDAFASFPGISCSSPTEANILNKNYYGSPLPLLGLMGDDGSKGAETFRVALGRPWAQDIIRGVPRNT